METEKIIQIESDSLGGFFALTSKGRIFQRAGDGKWNAVPLFDEVDKTLKGKKDETKRKNKGK